MAEAGRIGCDLKMFMGEPALTCPWGDKSSEFSPRSIWLDLALFVEFSRDML